MAEIKKGFGRRNVHCSNCGDERGGPFGHETSECRYRPGLSVFELTKMPHMAGRESEIWETYVDRYLDAQLASVAQPEPVTDAQYAEQFQRIAESEALILADELAEDGAHFAAMEERHQHEAEQPEGSDRDA